MLAIQFCIGLVIMLHGPPVPIISHRPAIAFISVFVIVNRDENPVFKLSWILVILVAPIFGVPFYMLFGNKRLGRRVARQMAKYQEHYEKEMRTVLPEPGAHVREELSRYSANLCRQADYIRNLTGAPAWDKTSVEYYPLGEQAFSSILDESRRPTVHPLRILKRRRGRMWTRCFPLLKRKLEGGDDTDH